MTERKPLNLEEIRKELILAERLEKKYKHYVEDGSYYLGIVDALRFVLYGEPLKLEEDENKNKK